MQERLLDAFICAWRSTDHNNRGFLGKCLRSCIGYLQTPNAICNTNRSQTTDPGVCVGYETGSLFITGIDHLQSTVFQIFVETKSIIAWHTKDMTNPVCVEFVNKVTAYGMYTVFIVFPQFRVLVGVGIGVGVAVLVVVGVGVGSSPTSCGHRSAEPPAGSVPPISKTAIAATGRIR